MPLFPLKCQHCDSHGHTGGGAKLPGYGTTPSTINFFLHTLDLTTGYHVSFCGIYNSLGCYSCIPCCCINFHRKKKGKYNQSNNLWQCYQAFCTAIYILPVYVLFFLFFCQPFYCYPYRTTITYASKRLYSCWKLICVKRINAGVGKRFANYDAATMQLWAYDADTSLYSW